MPQKCRFRGTDLPGRIFSFFLYALLCLFALFPPAVCVGDVGIINTKHNLSVSGPGEIKALTETRICVFCHTPHNASPQTPLWNKSLEAVTYVPYTSSTMSASPRQPNGPSRLCLSCHDGTLALGATLSPREGLETTGEVVATSSYLGTVLSNDHPFSFSYFDSIGNSRAGLFPDLPEGLVFYANGFIECSTCHDPHEDFYQSADINGQLTGKFLVMENQFSALCITCHSSVAGWQEGTHRITAGLLPLTGVLPVPPKRWPTWRSVAEWGCEGCHASHSAGGQQRLLYYAEEEKNCYACHNGKIAILDIEAQFQKFSAHPVSATSGIHDPIESPALITNRHVECEDCHNPHAANNRTAAPPSVSGRLDKVSGLDLNRVAVDPSTYEYEICFKCHADFAPQISFVPRVVDTTNKRLAFDMVNPSYHPVEGSGRNSDVPSIPSTYELMLTADSIIYCTSCHKDDNGVSRGPHGSNYAPILGYQYETGDGIPENFQNYALCYRCHNRTSILNNESFPRHREHIANDNSLTPRPTSCSVCHDSHGVPDDGGLSGDHTHLINFDIRVVQPTPGNIYPFFTDNGLPFSGSCTLVCHGKVHNNLSY